MRRTGHRSRSSEPNAGSWRSRTADTQSDGPARRHLIRTSKISFLSLSLSLSLFFVCLAFYFHFRTSSVWLQENRFGFGGSYGPSPSSFHAKIKLVSFNRISILKLLFILTFFMSWVQVRQIGMQFDFVGFKDFDFLNRLSTSFNITGFI